jgi:hypothetical protein
MRTMILVFSSAVVWAIACGSSNSAPQDGGPPDAPARDGAAGNDARSESGVDAGRRADGSADARSDTGPSDGCPDGSCSSFCSAKPAILAHATNVWDIAVDGTDAFFVVPGGGTGMPGAILRVPITGGKTTALATPPMPNGLVLAGGFAVFGDGNGGIYRIPVGGGKTSKIADTTGSPSRPATDGKSVYFADGDGVKSVSLAGGTVTLLMAGADAGQVEAVGVVGANLILAGNSEETVWSVPLKGGTVTTLATGQQFPLWPLDADGNPAWINSGDALKNGAIMEIETGKVTQIATGPGLTFPTWMTYDQGVFYVALGAGGFGPIGTVTASTGALGSVKGTAVSGGIAIAGDCIYYGSAFTKPPGLYVISK